MMASAFRRGCILAAMLLTGSVVTAEPLTPTELAMQVKPARVQGGHLAFRTEHCRVLVLQSGNDSILLVLPEGGEHAARVTRVVGRLSDLLFDRQADEPQVISLGEGKLVLSASLRQRMKEADCLGGSGVQALVALILSGEFNQAALNERGRLVLSFENGRGLGLQFYPAVARLDVLEIAGKFSGQQDASRIAEVLGYGDSASRSTRERLSRNLQCRVWFYNSDDEALMAERGGRIYVGQRDAVRKLLEGGKAPRAILRLPEEMAALPKPVVPPPPPMPGAAEALEAYLKYLRTL